MVFDPFFEDEFSLENSMLVEQAQTNALLKQYGGATIKPTSRNYPSDLYKQVNTNYLDPVTLAYELGITNSESQGIHQYETGNPFSTEPLPGYSPKYDDNYDNYQNNNIDKPSLPHDPSDTDSLLDYLSSINQAGQASAPIVETSYPEPITIEPRLTPIEMIAMKSKSQRLWSLRKLPLSQILEIYEHIYDNIFKSYSIENTYERKARNYENKRFQRQKRRYSPRRQWSTG